MTVRFKLLIAYILMLLILLGMGGVATWSVLRWQRAADSFQRINDQRDRAETLRVFMYRQIVSGLDFLSRVEQTDAGFNEADSLAHETLQQLRQFQQIERENDYIQALAEVHAELDWIGQQLFRQVADTAETLTLGEAHARLREISDEVTAGVSALNQYYRAEVNRRMQSALDTGRLAFAVISASVLLAIMELIAMIVLSHRWVVKPIGIVHRTTQILGSGNLEARANIASNDEWGALATSLNGMAGSLKALQEKVRDQERFASLGEIVAYTAHNLRNPLAGIRAAAQVTMKSVSTTDNETQASLSDILQTVDRMEVWIRGLLHLAKPTMLTLELKSVNELVAEVVQIETAACAAKEVRLETEMDANLPPVQMDQTLIEQALVAIITNARESNAGLITVVTAAELLPNDHGRALIRVVDNGKGISAEMMPRLFRAFVTDKPNGTGLGLAQVKKIMNLHGGSIDVASRPGEGTTVTLRLPVASTGSPIGHKPSSIVD